MPVFMKQLNQQRNSITSLMVLDMLQGLFQTPIEKINGFQS